jgi:N-acetylneuraminic acid mutarotase
LGWLNDLWEFNPTAKTWTWMGGSDTGDASLYGTPGIYGTLGVSSPSNVPGDRDAPVSWIDGGGNLWLFGGWGFDSTGATGVLNDLWEFSPITKEWTWMGGSDTGDASGVYGTEGVPSTTNVPGARYLAISWTDSSGNFWLFGGTGQVANSNDLWEFNPTNKEWTWVSGSDTGDASGVYGTLGVAAASNVPGGRSSLVSWTDSSGNLWLFGGGGGPTGILNDLWEFSPITKEWTWMGGSDTGDASGVYGTLGVAAASNVPGGRWNPVGWIDGSGNLWLFGGQGLDSTGTGGWLNDLWEFSPTTKEWTWMGGSNTTYANATQYQPDRGQPGVYGTEGVPATTNVPGGRYSAVSWTDNSGNFWLFGGAGHDSTAAQIGGLNDLWRYQP